MKIAVCCSEQEESKNIKNQLEEYYTGIGQSAQIHVFPALAFYKVAIKTPFDLLIDAYDSADALVTAVDARKLWPNMKILWLANNPGFFRQAQRVHAAEFLCKPYSKQQLFAALEKSSLI